MVNFSQTTVYQFFYHENWRHTYMCVMQYIVSIHVCGMHVPKIRTNIQLLLYMNVVACMFTTCNPFILEMHVTFLYTVMCSMLHFSYLNAFSDVLLRRIQIIKVLLYVCMFVCKYIHNYVCMYIGTDRCIFACMYVHTLTCIW